MTRLAADWVEDPRSQAVFDALEVDGFGAYFVGGCVRDGLLGRPVGDIDLATSARPEEVTELAEQAGLRVVPTGLDHGTVTVVSGGLPHEVTTFRKDVATDGRRATVAFTEHMHEDALRRDFTMNALYADRTGKVHDPLGGVSDLTAGHVRFIEVAEDRIREDYLRSLRFFRFYARFGRVEDGPDPEALAAIAGNLDGLALLSAERVGQEMLKLLSTHDPAPALAAMEQTGVLPAILPGADARAMPVLVHLEGARAVDPLRRLAALCATDPTERLRLSNAQSRDWAVTRSAAVNGDQPVAAIAYAHGAQVAINAALVRAALLGSPLPVPPEDEAARGAAQKFPVSAADLMPALQGAELGKRLKRLEATWVASDFMLSKEALLNS